VADPVVNDLIRKISRLVASDTGGRSTAAGEQLPGMTPTTEFLLRRLADNLDIPARLAPSPAAVVGRGPGPAYDERPDILAALTTVVAQSAANLDPREQLPAPADPSHRERLGTALSEAYAESAKLRLVPQLLRQGRPGDLGDFPARVLEGDVVAARALAFAIGTRTGQRDDQVLADLVGAGRGAAAPAAARMLLKRNPGFATLPGREQQEAVVRGVAGHLEAGFASRDLHAAVERQLTVEVENRRVDITGGVGAVDSASRLAAQEVQQLHDFLDKLPDWHPANQEQAERVTAASQPGAQIDRPESVYQLVRRIEGTVGELTGADHTLWNDRIEPDLGQSPDRTLRLTDAQALALRELTEDGAHGSLQSDVVAAAREGIQRTIAAQARWAVPEEYGRQHEEAAAAVAPRFTTIEQAVSTAFAEDHLNEVVERTLPTGLAEQVRLPDAPRLDSEPASAARGLASTIDTATGRLAGETLRRMAGEGRAGIAMAAAEVVVAQSAIPNVERPFAVRMIAETIDESFDELPDRLESWHRGEQTVIGDRHVDDPNLYGQQLGRVAQTMAEIYAQDPGIAQREAAAADRRIAQQDPIARFTPGHDPASPGFGTGNSPAALPTLSTANHPAAAQQSKRGLDR
jgi:hypothetical protein